MHDPFGNKPNPRSGRLDTWLESAGSRLRAGFAMRYEAFSTFMRRFRLRGFRRAGVELASDGLTFGAAGGILALALALPAFQATEVDWRTQGDYSVTFLDRFGTEIGKRGINHSDAVPLEEMPDYFITAVLATEDRRFFDHFGIDVFGTMRAMVANMRANAVVQGGSSLSQQLAKNLYLSNERTLERKIKEAFIAIWLEANMTKREILKLYLDRAYMGGGTFGAAAAAEFYFGKSIKDVTLAEAAMLAGLFKAPARYAPHVNLPAARARANQVLTNIVQAGAMTEGQVIVARRFPAKVIEQTGRASPDYFLDWAYEQVKRLVPSGDRVLTVRTTLDTNLQQAAEDAVEAALRESGDRFKVSQGSLVALEPDGSMRAMVGGRDYGESQFNRATDALRQPGSSFKPFVYAAAMMNGYEPKSIVPDAPITIGNWSPQNYARRYSGPMPLTTALVKSINTIPVRLAQAIGRGKIVDLAHKMGITNELLITRSLPLGVAEVSVIDMAASYAVFASGGFKATPFAVTQISNSEGQAIYDRRRDAKPPERVLEEKAAADMNFMLSQVPEWGTGTRAKLDGIRTAGKTGTTNDYRDAWFVGYTGNYVAAVWFGNDSFSQSNRLTGGLLPAETWKRFMTYAHAGIELKPIPFVEPEPKSEAKEDAVAEAGPGQAIDIGDRPLSLSDRTAQRLVALETLLLEAAPVTGSATAGPGAPPPAPAGAPRPARLPGTASLADPGGG